MPHLEKKSVPVWGADPAFRRAVAAAADGGGAWAARTASGPVRMRGDIFAAARRWRGRALPTGNLASRAARRRGAGAGGGAAAAGQGAAWTPLGLRLVLEAFRQVFFNTNALPRITIGADVWGESDIMTGVY